MSGSGLAPRAGFEPAVRSTVRFECRTGDSRAYSRPAPASRGPGYTTLARPGLTDGARARILISWAITLPERVQAETFLTTSKSNSIYYRRVTRVSTKAKPRTIMRQDSGEPVDGRVRCSLSWHRADQHPHRLSGCIHNLSLDHRFRSLARWRDCGWPSGHFCRSLGHCSSGNISGRSLDSFSSGADRSTSRTSSLSIAREALFQNGMVGRDRRINNGHCRRYCAYFHTGSPSPGCYFRAAEDTWALDHRKNLSGRKDGRSFYGLLRWIFGKCQYPSRYRARLPLVDSSLPALKNSHSCRTLFF